MSCPGDDVDVDLWQQARVEYAASQQRRARRDAEEARLKEEMHKRWRAQMGPPASTRLPSAPAPAPVPTASSAPTAVEGGTKTQRDTSLENTMHELNML